MSTTWIRVLECLQEALLLTDDQVASVTPETASWELPEWDSLAHMRLVASLEREFGVVLFDNCTAELTSVGSILAALSETAE
jgi:acyl carrier protein